MAFATAPCRSDQGSVRQTVLVLGSGRFATQIRDLFVRSRWKYEWPGNSDSALALLDTNEFPIVICEGYRGRVAERIGLIPNPPAMIAVVDEPNSAICDMAIDHGVLCLDSRQLRSGQLFPLLNHAWRMRNQD